MFLKVEKVEKRKTKEVDAKHLLFFMWYGDCEAVLTLFKRLNSLCGWCVIVKVVGEEGGNDAIY